MLRVGSHRRSAAELELQGAILESLPGRILFTSLAILGLGGFLFIYGKDYLHTKRTREHMHGHFMRMCVMEDGLDRPRCQALIKEHDFLCFNSARAGKNGAPPLDPLGDYQRCLMRRHDKAWVPASER